MPAPTLVKNPIEVRTGPGRVFWGAANATEPTWVATASVFSNSVPGMYSAGYSENGLVVTFGARQTATLTPAEEYEPIKIVTTGIDPTSVAFDTFGVSEVAMTYALNGGTWATVSGATTTLVRRYTPPAPGAETRCSLVFISADGDEVLYFAQLLQTGAVTRTFTKGATTSGLKGLQFQTEKPATGANWNYLTAGIGWTGPAVTV